MARCCLLLLMVAAHQLSAQQVLRITDLSAVYTAVAGTPHVVRNTADRIWIAAWRQSGSPDRILARIVKSDGAPGLTKVLVEHADLGAGGFSLAYNESNANYLLVYESPQGLLTQRLTRALARVGSPARLGTGASSAHPRLLYDAEDGTYRLFWLEDAGGQPGKTLAFLLLDASGKPASVRRQIAQAAAGKRYVALTCERRNAQQSLIALVTVSDGAVLGFLIRPDGSPLRSKPLVLQPPSAAAAPEAWAAFNDAGLGFAVWNQASALRYRKISPSGSLASPPRSVPNAADANSRQSGVVFDSVRNAFISVWALANTVRAASINPGTGAIRGAPFDVATSELGNSRNVSGSYDPQQGNVLAVWEDSSAAGSVPGGAGVQFRVRSALFAASGQGSEIPVTVGDNFFAPAVLTIPAGTVVRWVNEGFNQHTVTSGTPTSQIGFVFDSPVLNHVQSFSFRFTQTGSIPYFCRVHGSRQAGTIVVTN